MTTKLSLEKMIEWCASFGPNYESGDGKIATQIAAVLRTAQRMRAYLRSREDEIGVLRCCMDFDRFIGEDK